WSFPQRPRRMKYTDLRTFRRHSYQSQRFAVAFTMIILVQQAFEDGPGRRNTCEKRRTGSQLQVIGRAENLMSRSTLHANNRAKTLRQMLPQNGMSQISLSFGDALDREMLGGRAEPEAIELGKDVPHPMRLLLATLDLAERLFVVAFLRVEEAAQVVRV